MSLLLETIMVLNRQPVNLIWHQHRYERAMRELFGIEPVHDLESIISIPDDCDEGILRCRVVYGPGSGTVEFSSYVRKKISTLKLVYSNSIDYSFKYYDRTALTQLYDQRKDCDDIIVVKNGLLTDSYYANLVFFDGNEWVTPVAPLLKGTQRSRLLANNCIREAEITTDNYSSFEKVGLINAFNDLAVMPQIDICNVVR